MEIVQGIYKISNTVNDKVYVGQSVHIHRRWLAHLRSARGDQIDSQFPIHRAMNEIGIEKFSLEVIEEVPNKEDLNDREIFWIAELNSYDYGYNATKGGSLVQGEDNPRAILSEVDVKTIRTLYAQRVPFREAFHLFEGVISKRGFQKVWHYETWLKVMPEVYTEENKRYHATLAKGFQQEKLSNEQRKLSEEEIKTIRKLHSEGLPFTQIAKKLGRAPSTVRKYALGLEGKKSHSGISIKNIQTGKVFESYKSAAEWAGCDRKMLSNFVNGKTILTYIGRVPETGEEATWTLDI